MKKFIEENWVKIFAISLLLIALGDHPYSYYTLLRWLVTIIGALVAYDFYENKNTNWMWLFIAIAILFNPIFLIYFSKDTWQLLDLITAVIFLVSIFIKSKN